MFRLAAGVRVQFRGHDDPFVPRGMKGSVTNWTEFDGTVDSHRQISVNWDNDTRSSAPLMHLDILPGDRPKRSVVEVQWQDARDHQDPLGSCVVRADVDLNAGDVVDITGSVHMPHIKRTPGDPRNLRIVIAPAKAGQRVRVR